MLLLTKTMQVFMPPLPTTGSERHCVGWSCIRCLSVNAYFVWHDINVHSREISIKLATNNHYVSGNCCKVFQGKGSEVKTIPRPNAIFRLKDTQRLTAIHQLSPSVSPTQCFMW